ncbi:MAG: T9SS type A sorting domain-containing protein [Bacteroidota bacterium]
MKTIKYILLCGVLFAHYFGVKAQVPNISVESMSGFPAQAEYNSLYSFSVMLQNNDSADYQGQLYIAFHTDSANVIDTGHFGNPVNVNIPGNSFHSITISGFYFIPSTFKLGGNVVVVWPVSTNGSQIMVTDSFYTVVEIMGYAGISDLYLCDANNYIYPVPANEVLFLPQNIVETNVEHIRIIDIPGRQKYYSDKAVTSINTTFLDQGIYFIEIKEKNKIPKIFKFIISR